MQNETSHTTQNAAAEQSEGAQAVKPVRSLRWYDYLWSSLPIALLYTGGKFGVAGNVLGGLVGIGAVWLNLRILRGQRGVMLRYFLSLLLTAGAYVAFAILITLYQVYTHQL